MRPGDLTGDALLADAADPEALALLLYTSGTSGEPRAAMLTHRALLANVEHLTRLADQDADAAMNADDVVLGVLPLFHVFGLNAVLGWVLRDRRLAGADPALRLRGHARTGS